jgi:hypothetical protein
LVIENVLLASKFNLVALELEAAEMDPSIANVPSAPILMTFRLYVFDF